MMQTIQLGISFKNANFNHVQLLGLHVQFSTTEQTEVQFRL